MATSIVAGLEGTVTYTGVTGGLRAQVVGVEEVVDVNDCSGIGIPYRINFQGMRVLRISLAGSAMVDSTSGITVTGLGQIRASSGVTFTFVPKNSNTASITCTGIISNLRYGKDINGNDAFGVQMVSSDAYTVT